MDTQPRFMLQRERSDGQFCFYFTKFGKLTLFSFKSARCVIDICINFNSEDYILSKRAQMLV